MSMQRKPLSQQVMVITGASSGIGLVTARSAARHGARIVLVARDDAALDALADEMRQQGCEAIAVSADVGSEADVLHVVQRAIEHFGQFDTWVNNAGVSIFGPIDKPTMDENSCSVCRLSRCTCSDCTAG